MLCKFKWILICVIAIPLLGYADGWQVQTVDVGRIWGYTSLQLDSDGDAHISYLEQVTSYYLGRLKYARWDGSAWQVDTVEIVDGHPGCYSTSLALDTTGLPHIAYLDIPGGSSTRALKYASWNDGSLEWDITIADDNGHMSVGASLFLDANDSPHVVYYETNNEELRYAYRDGEMWETEVINSGIAVGGFSISVDAEGIVHLAYAESSGLIYARRESDVWSEELVVGGEVDEPSLTLDSLCNPCISYIIDYSYLECALLSDFLEWQIELVDSCGTLPWYQKWHNSSAVDGSNNVCISYFDQVAYDLKYAIRVDEQNWHTEIVDSVGETGFGTSIDVDNRDHPHISYMGGDDLRCAEYVEAPRFIRGDATSAAQAGYGDGTVDLADAVYILQVFYLPVVSPPRCWDALDVNDDGDLRMADAIYLLRFLHVPGSPSPPPPCCVYPDDCGQDPTEDGLGCEDHPCID